MKKSIVFLFFLVFVLIFNSLMAKKISKEEYFERMRLKHENEFYNLNEVSYQVDTDNNREYCDSFWNNDTDDWITNVNFNSINNDTGQEGGPQSYGDYTNISTGVVIGLSYAFSMTWFSEGLWTEYGAVWFDWNQDEDFYDEGEYFEVGSGVDATVSIDISIPVYAVLGATRMRVSERYYTWPEPCNDSGATFGETEDYTVIITDEVPDTGFIEGYVTLEGGEGNVEDVLLQCWNQTTNPDETGWYQFELYPGTYDLFASLIGYWDWEMEDIELDENEHVVIDILLEEQVGFQEIGDEEIEDYHIPVNLWYCDSMTEFIYLQEWIIGDMLIESVAFHANTSSTLTDQCELEIWMGETEQDDLSAGWIDGSQLTQVYNGSFDVPPGDSWVEVQLNTPFEYEYSANLVVLVIRNDDEYYSTQDTWWCTESNTEYRSRFAYTDDFSMDPSFDALNGPFTSTYGETIYPDIQLFYSDLEHGSVNGTVTDLDTGFPIEEVEVYVGNWGPDLTDSEGEYLIEDIVIGMQDVFAVKEGYYDFFGQVEVLTDQQVEYDFAMEPNVYGSIGGYVNDADSGDPLIGAEINAISASGYEYDALTDDNGIYFIADVVVETYDVFCSFPNYPTEVEEDVDVLEGATVLVDFTLEGYAYWCDFENNDGGLNSDNAQGWQWGIPGNGPEVAHSGSNLWGTVISDDYPSGSNFSLITPMPFMVDSPLSMLEFWHWYDTESSFDGGNVKISTDGGTNWTVIEPLTDYPGVANTSNPLNGEPIFCGHDQGFWEFVQFDLSGYIGQSVMFRWHFGSDGSIQYPGWFIDDVSICGAYTPDPGWLAGIVTEYDSDDPIEGAMVSLPGTGYSAVTENDGTYMIEEIWPGEYNVICESEYYIPFEVTDFTIQSGENILDMVMLWSEIAVDPESFMINLSEGGFLETVMIITNDGPGELEFNISFLEENENRCSISPFDSKIIRGPYATSIGLAPENGIASVFDQEVINPIILREETAWGIENANAFFCSMDLAIPEVLNNLGPEVTGGFSNAGTFAPGDPTIAYALDNSNLFGYYDVETGLFTDLGTIVPEDAGDQTWTGICIDPTSGTWYGVTTDVYNSNLYEIDPQNLSSSLVGDTGQPGLIDVCIDGNGTMYSYDLVTDEFVSIDKNTGIATVIGSLGYDANFGQGMAWDSINDIIYLSAFNNATFQPELRIADRTTGNTTMVGVIGENDPGGLCQMGWMAIPLEVAWISFDPTSGVVDPNGGQFIVSVYFDGSELLEGEIHIGNIIIANNSNYQRGDDLLVPVTIIVIENEEEENLIPLKTQLQGNYPNPFNPETTIAFSLKKSQDIEIAIYNIRGERINTLLKTELNTGDHNVVWDGTDYRGKSVSSGIYFLRMQAGKYSATRKMILMK